MPKLFNNNGIKNYDKNATRIENVWTGATGTKKLKYYKKVLVGT